jgi:hypothetical protein
MLIFRTHIPCIVCGSPVIGDHFRSSTWTQTARCSALRSVSWLKKAPWPESASKLYRPSDHRLSEKLVLTFADRGCHVVSVTDPYGRILGFLDRSVSRCFCYLFPIDTCCVFVFIRPTQWWGLLCPVYPYVFISLLKSLQVPCISCCKGSTLS